LEVSNSRPYDTDESGWAEAYAQSYPDPNLERRNAELVGRAAGPSPATL